MDTVLTEEIGKYLWYVWRNYWNSELGTLVFETNVSAFQTVFHPYTKFEKAELRTRKYTREQALSLILRDQEGVSLVGIDPEEVATRIWFPFAFETSFTRTQLEGPAFQAMLAMGKYLPAPPPDAKVLLPIKWYFTYRCTVTARGSWSKLEKVSMPQTVINKGPNAIKQWLEENHLPEQGLSEVSFKEVYWDDLQDHRNVEIEGEPIIGSGSSSPDFIFKNFNSGVYQCQM